MRLYRTGARYPFTILYKLLEMSTENLQSSPTFIDCTILYRIFESRGSLDTVNEKIFAGLNFRTFPGFKEYYESFSVNIYLYYTIFV